MQIQEIWYAENNYSNQHAHFSFDTQRLLGERRRNANPAPVQGAARHWTALSHPRESLASPAGIYKPISLEQIDAVARLEKEWGFHYQASRHIVYEKIGLIRPERRAKAERRVGAGDAGEGECGCGALNTA